MVSFDFDDPIKVAFFVEVLGGFDVGSDIVPECHF